LKKAPSPARLEKTERIIPIFLNLQQGIAAVAASGDRGVKKKAVL